AKAPAGASPPAGDPPPNGDPTPAAPAAVDEDEIRRQAAAEAEAKANARIVRSEVRALATGRLSDPSDALRFLDLDSFEVAEDGAVDEEEITDAIGDLLTKKPYLAAAQRTKRFEGSGDGGAKPPKPAMSRSLGEAVSKALHQT
ncbi:MAG: hypothetical protein ACRDYV_09905, partial [Acidimicrobiia bacterium]